MIVKKNSAISVYNILRIYNIHVYIYAKRGTRPIAVGVVQIRLLPFKGIGG